jgi:transposase
MKKCINKLFNLQGVLIDRLESLEDKKEIIIHCRSSRICCECPNCHQSTKKVHQYHYRKIRHAQVNNQAVILNLRIRRFKCRRCQKVFSENINGISRKKTSLNFRQEIISWLQRNSFNYIGQRFNLSGSTLNRYVADLKKEWRIDFNELSITKLGIDEHSFRGHNLIGTITDISHHRLLSLLKSDSQKEIMKYLVNLPENTKKNIEEVCIDLKWSYRVAIRTCLPNAKIVADRFHVEQLAKRALDEIRSVIQNEARGSRGHMKKVLLTNHYLLSDYEKIKLEMIWQKYEKWPVLKQAWIIKEKIISFYQLKNYDEAKKEFKYIMMLLETPEYSYYLESLRRTLKRWRTEIINYFISRTTNGFTEGCHTKIKLMKRVSYGFRNIDNYIAKMTLAFIPLVWIFNLHTN